MARSRLVVVYVCLALAGCGRSQTPDAQQISGGEALQWDQLAANATEVASFGYILYVDEMGAELANVLCGRTAGPAGFVCTARLPPMTPGPHRLTLSAFRDGGTRLESPRSAPLDIVVVGQSSGMAPAASATLSDDDVRLRTSLVAGGLDEPTDLAFAPDGRIFVAERAGRVRVIRNGRLLRTPALILSDIVAVPGSGLLAFALDPRFDQNGLLYTVYTAEAGFRLARFRLIGDAFTDRVVLMDGVEHSAAEPASSLRFGPDGQLYVAFDDAGDPVRAADVGSFNGKVARLNADATAPGERAGGTPVFSLKVGSPRGLDWDSTGTLWIADQTADGQGRLQAVVGAPPYERGQTTVASYVYPAGSGAAGLALYRGDAVEPFRRNLFVSAEDGRAVLRFRLDVADPWRILSTERLLADTVGRIRAVGVAPWGAVYLCTDRAVLQLSPEAPAAQPTILRMPPVG